jgi:lysophospholipase L1-like esterase
MKKLLSVIIAALFCASQAFAGAPPIPPSAPISLSQPNISGPATVRQVTNRTGIANTISGSNTKINGRSWQMAYVPVSALKVCIPNYYVSSSTSGVETTSGGAVSAHIVVEYPRGTFKDLTWSGSTPGSVAALSNGCSDLTALGFTIPAYAKFRINYFLDWSGGAGKAVYSSWSNTCDRGNGDEFAIGTVLTDNSGNDTVLGSNTPANCWFPGAVMAYSDRSVWWLIGDSIVAGVNDMLGDPSGGRGLLGRAAAYLGPQLNFGVPGDRASYYATGSNAALRTALAATAGATSALVQLGVNDFFSGSRTADNVLTDRATVRAAAVAAIPGIHVYDTTITPETTSTDGWNTTVNQTTLSVANNNSRMAFNDFLRGVTSYTATCTLAGTTSVTGCTGLTVTTAATGMYASGTNLPASDVITAINQYAGTFTLTTTASGSGATSVTFAWPSFSTSFPTSSAGLIDIARLVECSVNQASVLVPNGGLWCPGYVGQTDGIHPTSFTHIQVEQLLMNQLAVLR